MLSSKKYCLSVFLLLISLVYGSVVFREKEIINEEKQKRNNILLFGSGVVLLSIVYLTYRTDIGLCGGSRSEIMRKTPIFPNTSWLQKNGSYW